MQKHIRNALKSMNVKFRYIHDFWAERSARRALAKLMVRAGAVPNRWIAARFFAQCNRLTGEPDILEAIYKLGTSENYRKYKVFLNKHGHRIELLYHACFSKKSN